MLTTVDELFFEARIDNSYLPSFLFLYILYTFLRVLCSPIFCLSFFINTSDWQTLFVIVPKMLPMRFHKSSPNVLSNIGTFSQPVIRVFYSKFRFLRLSPACKLILSFAAVPVKTLWPFSNSIPTMFHQRCSFISSWRQSDALVSVSVVICVSSDLWRSYSCAAVRASVRRSERN